VKRKTTISYLWILTTILLVFIVNISQSFASSSANYSLDFDGINTGSDKYNSADYELQSGFTSIETNSSSVNYQITTINNIPAPTAVAVCGNGIIESGEVCDTTNFAGQSCSDYGFDSGSLSCVICTSISTSSCFNSSTGGGTSGGGGGDSTFVYSEPEELIPPTITTPNSDLINHAIDQITTISEKPIEPIDTAVTDTVDKAQTDLSDKSVLTTQETASTTKSLVSQEFTATSDEYYLDSSTKIETRQFIDETPVIVDNLVPNSDYTIFLKDKSNEILEESQINTNTQGVFIYETTTHLLESNDYYIEIFDKDLNSVKYYKIHISKINHVKMIIDTFFQIDTPIIDFEEIIDLGEVQIKKDQKITGRTEAKTEIYVYFQNTKKEILKIQTWSDEKGNFEILIPEELTLGKQTVTIIQKFSDKSISKDIQYKINLIKQKETEEKTQTTKEIIKSPTNIIIALILILGLPTILWFYRRKKNRHFRHSNFFCRRTKYLAL